MVSSHAALLLCVLLPLFTFNSFTLATCDEKVKLDLYYETLCPYCSTFMTDDLVTIFENVLINIIDLHLVPYGNAKLGGSNNTTIVCQHDKPECELNTVRGCAIYAWPDVHYDEFMTCVCKEYKGNPCQKLVKIR